MNREEAQRAVDATDKASASILSVGHNFEDKRSKGGGLYAAALAALDALREHVAETAHGEEDA